jgi:membrane protein required for colicin V production
MLASFFRGFLREAISIATWIAAILLALKFSSFFGAQLTAHIANENLRSAISFFLIFMVVFVSGSVIGYSVKAFVSKTGLGFLDRLLGVFFGFARGILAIAVLLMILYYTPFQKEIWYKQSSLAQSFQPLVSWMQSFVPNKMKQVDGWVSNKQKEGV